MKIPFWKKKHRIYNRATVNSINGKILVHDIESLCKKTYPKFVTLSSFFKIFMNLEKLKKIYMDSEKLIHLLKMKKILPIICEFFLGNLLITFWHYYYAKYMLSTSLKQWVWLQLYKQSIAKFLLKIANEFKKNQILFTIMDDSHDRNILQLYIYIYHINVNNALNHICVGIASHQWRYSDFVIRFVVTVMGWDGVAQCYASA